MSATTFEQVNTLQGDARCLLCLDQKSLLATAVYLLWLNQNPGQEMTFAQVNALVADSACVLCMDEKSLLAAMVQLLYTGGGGGGGGTPGVTPGAGLPPTDGSVTTLFYKDTDTGVIYINTGTVAVPTWDSI